MKPIALLSLLLLAACGADANAATCKRPSGAYSLELTSPTCGTKHVEAFDLNAETSDACSRTEDTFEHCDLERSTVCTGYSDHLSLHVDSPGSASGSYVTEADAGTCDYTVQAVAK